MGICYDGVACIGGRLWEMIQWGDTWQIQGRIWHSRREHKSKQPTASAPYITGMKSIGF